MAKNWMVLVMFEGKPGVWVQYHKNVTKRQADSVSRLLESFEHGAYGGVVAIDIRQSGE